MGCPFRNPSLLTLKLLIVLKSRIVAKSQTLPVCKVLLAGDDELISHETLVYMVNVEGLLGEDLFEQPQQKLREELKPEERNLKKILREESNKEQTRSPFNTEDCPTSIKDFFVTSFIQCEL